MDSRQEIALLGAVRLKNSRPADGLSAGEIGTVVEVFDYPERAYEVEFVDDQGRTTAQVALLPGEIEALTPAELKEFGEEH